MTTIYTHGATHPLFERSIERILLDAGLAEAIEVQPAPDRYRQVLEKWRSGEDAWLSVALENCPELIDNCKAQVFLWGGLADKFTRQIERERPPIAKWGFTLLAPPLALEFSASKKQMLATQLHEVLHCFNVDDCYDDNDDCAPKSTCNSDACVMRYGNLETRVCDHVVTQLVQYFRARAS